MERRLDGFGIVQAAFFLPRRRCVAAVGMALRRHTRAWNSRPWQRLPPFCRLCHANGRILRIPKAACTSVFKVQAAFSDVRRRLPRAESPAWVRRRNAVKTVKIALVFDGRHAPPPN